MNLALRWRITLAFSLVLALVFAVLSLYLQAAALQSGTADMADSLRGEAQLTALALPAKLRPGATLQRLVQDLDQRSGARVTLIGSAGTVLADSREEPQGMENHAQRPERLQAVGEGWGQSTRYSHTLKLDMLYVAMALPATGTPPVVLRLAEPMQTVADTSRWLRRVILTVFAVALLLVWVVSYLIAGALTAPVQELVRVARRVDRGDLQARVGAVSGAEVGALARVFNAALDRLAALVEHSRRESRHYAAILEQMGDAVVIVDHGGKVEFLNPPFRRLFGVTEPAAEGHTAQEVTLSFDLSALLLRAIEQNTVQRDEIRLMQPEGLVLATVVTPLVDEAGSVVGAIGLLRDVTDRRRVEEMRREFVANASHELRTPAAGIKALAEVLQSGAFRDPEKGPRFVGQIVEAADRLTYILDDMLTLTRVERGQELLSAVWVPAPEAVAEAVRTVLPTAQARGVAVAPAVPSDDRVFADPSALQTILINLLDNAVKYSPEGETVTVTGRAVPGGYEFAVADHGVGIPEEHLPRIFERFYRVDKARDRATGGTGLGLSIVKHTVEAHGGRVTVRSQPGQGSTFTVVFPAPNGAAKA